MKGRRYALFSVIPLALLTVVTSVSGADTPGPLSHRDVTVVRALGNEASSRTRCLQHVRRSGGDALRVDARPAVWLPGPGRCPRQLRHAISSSTTRRSGHCGIARSPLRGDHRRAGAGASSGLRGARRRVARTGILMSERVGCRRRDPSAGSPLTLTVGELASRLAPSSTRCPRD